MKIYVSYTFYDNHDLSEFESAIDKLRQNDHEILDIYSVEEFSMDSSYQEKMFSKSERAIKESDILILEVSHPNRRIGYEQARALDEGKIVIAIYKDTTSKLPPNIAGNRNPNLIKIKYNEKNISKVLSSVLKQAKQLLVVDKSKSSLANLSLYFTTGYENPKKSNQQIKEILKFTKNNSIKTHLRPLKKGLGVDEYNINEKKLKHIFDFRKLSVEKINELAKKKIAASDIVIAESSYFISPGLGYEIAYAINKKIPVIILQHEDSKEVISEVITGESKKGLRMIKYNNGNLNELLEKNISKIMKKLKSKFILQTTSEIDQFLEWKIKNSNTNRSELVRTALDNMISSNQKYQKSSNF